MHMSENYNLSSTDLNLDQFRSKLPSREATIVSIWSNDHQILRRAHPPRGITWHRYLSDRCSILGAGYKQRAKHATAESAHVHLLHQFVFQMNQYDEFKTKKKITVLAKRHNRRLLQHNYFQRRQMRRRHFLSKTPDTASSSGQAQSVAA